MSERVRLVVVDDHALFRRGLVGLLRDMPEFEVAAEASNGEQALAVLAQVQADIILLDLNMPVMDGLGVVEAVRRAGDKPRILMLTISQNDADLLAAIRAGADGYLLKNTEPEDLRRALLRVAQGQSVLSPEVTAPVLRALIQSGNEAPQSMLSEREMEILDLLALGQTTQQIASGLFLSENTIKTHVRHILEKLGAANRTEAVSKAMQLGILRQKR
ncbi:response regulator [Levilinea saccharolytica]|uniref:Uncharacterized protein n=1 Tax=Levilinea saccharolytica TaxID=229921 RepID=A0A0P6YTX9_9CHLR|nr:response regulator transcription factor [Levilinea saccharolytica]KPL86988.1 hypothetical protein ADN01_05100 [Levilinea saccharolytica]GAP17506.1 two component transcriptional regulator, LuxR family [Levilinea saccharolytica]